MKKKASVRDHWQNGTTSCLSDLYNVQLRVSWIERLGRDAFSGARPRGSEGCCDRLVATEHVKIPTRFVLSNARQSLWKQSNICIYSRVSVEKLAETSLETRDSSIDGSWESIWYSFVHSSAVQDVKLHCKYLTWHLMLLRWDLSNNYKCI